MSRTETPSKPPRANPRVAASRIASRVAVDLDAIPMAMAHMLYKRTFVCRARATARPAEPEAKPYSRFGQRRRSCCAVLDMGRPTSLIRRRYAVATARAVGAIALGHNHAHRM